MDTRRVLPGDGALIILTQAIRSTIERWVESGRGEDYWREPLVAVASAHDPLFHQLKDAVSPEHGMPEDLLKGAQSVIAFFLPFRQWVGEANVRIKGLSARSWAESYTATNGLIQVVGETLKEAIQGMGHAVAVTPPTHNFDSEKLVSAWSHKHVAYIAGLGTFGHHRLLITEAGCCGRLGSLVTTMTLAATPRPEKEYCLAKRGESCHACVSQCRYNALLKTHFDRHACYRQCLVNDAHFSDLPLTDVCGKCACQVPCSYSIPNNPP